MCKRAAALATTRQALKKRRAEAASSARAASMARVRTCAQRRVDRWEAVAPAVRAALKKDGYAVLAFAGPQIKASGHTHVSRAEVDRVSADIIELSKRDDMFGLFQSLKRTRRGAAVVPDGGDGKRKYVRLNLALRKRTMVPARRRCGLPTYGRRTGRAPASKSIARPWPSLCRRLV
jgi:hypothetical protein